MNESINIGPSPEEEADVEADFLRDYLERHPTPVVVPLESSPSFESLVADFEAKHSLEELLEIRTLSPELLGMFLKDRDVSGEVREWLLSVLSPEDVRRYRARSSAKIDLEPIAEALKTYSSGREAYMRLSRAVGMISGNEIDHER